MKVFYVTIILHFLIFEACSFIIPDEVPSLLSVIYSNIPTIKKGTDSRLGWGFRLGDRADFQVLVELGPQTNTQPLGNQNDNGSSSKRNTIDSLSNVLYAQRQKVKKDQERNEQISDSEGGKWLQNWSKTVRNNNDDGEETENLPLEPRPGLAIGEIDAKSVIPDDETLALEELRSKLNKKQTVGITKEQEEENETSDKN